LRAEPSRRSEPGRRRKADGGPADAGIKITTIHSAKGLQFRAVILMWADLLPSKLTDRNEAAERMLMYVAMTRAEDTLVITHSDPSSYVDEVVSNVAAFG
jgi:superfamily I DNA/RNA helicase